jgi:hypothetical protein
MPLGKLGDRYIEFDLGVRKHLDRDIAFDGNVRQWRFKIGDAFGKFNFSLGHLTLAGRCLCHRTGPLLFSTRRRGHPLTLAPGNFVSASRLSANVGLPQARPTEAGEWPPFLTGRRGTLFVWRYVAKHGLVTIPDR